MYKRVIIKISGEMIGGEGNLPFNNEIIGKIVNEVKQLVENGTEVSLVVGGGNFWRGRSAPPTMNNARADQIGMLATVMNGIYLCEAFIGSGINAVCMTPFDVNMFTERFTVSSAVKHMQNGNVVIFAGGTGHPFFSTDTILGLRAQELSVDAVIFAKNIDGVYDSNPKTNKAAKKFKTVSYKTVVEKGLEFADIPAICVIDGTKNTIPSVVFSLDTQNGIVVACQGDDDGIFTIGGTKIQRDIKEEFYGK